MPEDDNDTKKKEEKSLIESDDLVIKPHFENDSKVSQPDTLKPEPKLESGSTLEPELKPKTTLETESESKTTLEPELEAKTEPESGTILEPDKVAPTRTSSLDSAPAKPSASDISSLKKQQKEYTEGERLFDFRLKRLKKGGPQKKKRPVNKYEFKKPKLFELRKNQEKSFAKAFMRNASIFIVSLLIFAGNLYIESDLFAADDISLDEEGFLMIPSGQTINLNYEGETMSVSEIHYLKESENISTGDVQNVQIKLPGYGVVRLGKDTSISVNEFITQDNKYDFNLNSGEIWVNTMYSNYDLSVNTEYVSINPGKASVYISYDGSLTSMYSDKHDALVIIKNSNGDDLNRFWLAEGNRAEASNSKIISEAETIDKLLYAKLIKEFKYSKMSSSNINDNEWISSQKKYDIDLRDAIYERYYSNLRSKGLNFSSQTSLRSQAKSLLSDMQNLLIFSDTRKVDQILDAIFENLADAQYLYAQANDTDAQTRLFLFEQDINQSKYLTNDYFVQESFKKLKNSLSDMYFIAPNDSLYPVKSKLYDILMQRRFLDIMGSENQFDYLTLKLNDVYDSINIETARAVGVFFQYFDLYQKLRDMYVDDLRAISDQIIKQNILVDNILFFNPDLYKISFFNKKNLMENDYILAIENERDKREQRQTLISRKIDLLNRIRYFVFDDRLSVDDARQVVFSIIQNIENLKKETSDVAAISQLFERRLEDFGVFWQYLNSPEYSSVPLHGASHNERFESFKKVQKDIITFSEIQEEILGDAEKEERSVRSVIYQAEDDLKNAGITDVEFGFYEDVSNKRIPILSAKVSGIEFRATYDWDREILSNILVNDDILTSEGVKLSNAKKLIFESISSRDVVYKREPDSEPDTVRTDPEEDVQRAAKVFIKQKFTQIGIVLETSNVEVEDLSSGDYLIENVYFSELSDAIFTFNYSTINDKVSNLSIDTNQGEKNVTDSFSPTFLKAVVRKVYEESL